MDYTNGIKPDKMRFYKDIEYIGVKTDYPMAKNFCNYDIKTIEIRRFYGKPYSRYDFETYYIFSQTKWDNLITQLQNDAKKYNMEVVNKNGYAGLIPIWIHTVKSEVK